MKKTRFSVKLVCYIVMVSLVALLISASMISIRMIGILESDMPADDGLGDDKLSALHQDAEPAH